MPTFTSALAGAYVSGFLRTKKYGIGLRLRAKVKGNGSACAYAAPKDKEVWHRLALAHRGQRKRIGMRLRGAEGQMKRIGMRLRDTEEQRKWNWLARTR